MMVKSIMFKLLIVYCLLLLTILFFIPIGNTGADSTTPEIKIDALPQMVLYDINNFKPGDWAPRVLTVQNNGNQDFSYNIQARMKSGSTKLFNIFHLTIEDQSDVLFNGELKEFKGLKRHSLAAFSEEKLTVTVVFPYVSGNEFQGLDTEVEFVLYAEGESEQPPTDPDNPGGDDGESETPGHNGGSPNKPTGTLPPTGEDNQLFLILTGLFLSMAGIALLLVKNAILPNPFKR